jgi:hypothetical protein
VIEDARTRRPVRFLLIAGIGLMAVLLGIRIIPELGVGTVLPIRNIRIFGVRFVSKREIIQRLGVDSARSLVFFHTRAGELELLRDQRVARVEMVKVYPETLKVHILEKEPRAVVDVSGRAYLVSGDGVVLGEEDSSDYSDYPHITLIANSDDIKSGYPVKNVLLLNYLAALAEMEGEYPGYAELIDAVTIDGSGVSVAAGEGRYRVYLGSTVTTEKLEKMRAILLVLDEPAPAGAGPGTFDIDMNFSHAAVQEGENSDALR